MGDYFTQESFSENTLTVQISLTELLDPNSILK
jgi:hypothetical protein